MSRATMPRVGTDTAQPAPDPLAVPFGPGAPAGSCASFRPAADGGERATCPAVPPPARAGLAPAGEGR